MEQEIYIGLEPEIGTQPEKFYRINATNFTAGINQEIVEDEYIGGPNQTSEMSLEKTEGAPSFDLRLGNFDPDATTPVFADLVRGIYRNNWAGFAPRTGTTIALTQDGADWWLEDATPWTGADVGHDQSFARGTTYFRLFCIGVDGNRLRVIGDGLTAQAAGTATTVRGRNIRNGDETLTYALSYQKGDVWYHYTRLSMGKTTVETQRRGLLAKLAFTGQLVMNKTALADGLLEDAPEQVIRPDHGGGHWMADTWMQQFNIQIGAAGTPEYDLFEAGPIDVEFEKFSATGDVTVRWKDGDRLLAAYNFLQENVFMQCRARTGTERPTYLWRFPTAKVHEPSTASSGALKQETFKFTATGFDHENRRKRNYLAQLAVI